jgi:hypothetical protein
MAAPMFGRKFKIDHNQSVTRALKESQRDADLAELLKRNLEPVCSCPSIDLLHFGCSCEYSKRKSNP